MGIKNRIVEAYIGEYASGKSENAIARALDLSKEGRKVTLVDLDFVEPFYTLRPLKRPLSEKGIDVVAWETNETVGLGEAGSTMKPEMRWVLHREGDIILDIGYGVSGARILNLIEGASNDPDLKIITVVNISRPFTATVPDIIEYVRGIGKCAGVINNSHLGDETTIELIQRGAKLVTEAAGILGIPVIATSAEEKLRPILGEKDCMGNPIQYLSRYMKDAFW